MTLPPLERANHSVWGAKKGTFEIWFFVVFDPGSNRAFWIRYEATHLLQEGPASRAGLVWASAFERRGPRGTPSVVSAKRIAPLEDCEIARDRFHVRIGEASLSSGRLSGEVGSGAGRIAWSLTYEPAARPSIRSPAWLDRLPLPMHGVHANTEVPFSGWVEVGSVRHELSSARGTQEHLFGKERPDEIRWVYASGLDGDPGSYVELAQVRPRKAGPALTFASVSTPRVSVDATTLRSVPRARVVAGARPEGWLSGRAETRDRAMIVAAHAARESFAGYVYRDPRGHDLYVAQSDLAHIEVEVFEKGPLGRRRPIHRTVAPGGALELHQPTPLAGIRYLPWPAETPDADPEVGVAPTPPVHPTDGELLPLPIPTRMFAAGLTYADHAQETGSSAEPVMFEKSISAWLGDGELVTRPADASVCDALDGIEPGLGSALLERWGFIPALLDYEVEIGLYLLADIEPRDLVRRDCAPSVGYFVANDLTHRTCQILGEGARDPMAFWSASKSFAGFCPVTKTMWVPSRPSLDSLPEVTLATFVRGERRQQAHSTALAVPVRVLLSAAMKRAGRGLRAGEVVLTGTPSGIALKVPAWKRALGRRFLDRFARAEAAFGLYTSAPEAFLTPGSAVTVEAGFLGRRTIVVA